MGCFLMLVAVAAIIVGLVMKVWWIGLIGFAGMTITAIVWAVVAAGDPAA